MHIINTAKSLDKTNNCKYQYIDYKQYKSNNQNHQLGSLIENNWLSQNKILDKNNPLICICIGSDGIPGDSLGPFVGSLLMRRKISDLVIYGTLDQPVHAQNLISVLSKIKMAHPKNHIIAIDACLGKKELIGYIRVGSGPLYPGAGVQKKLPAVGHAHILGIVGDKKKSSLNSLKRVRMNVVFNMAEIIAKGISEMLKQNALNQIRTNNNA